MRLVAYRKAITAGMAGAAAWEAAVAVLRAVGVPLFDLMPLVSGAVLGGSPHWQSWLAATALHLLVGVVWAVFYAYFFFYTYDWPPAIQGLAFSSIPCVLAGLIMVPQIGLMNPSVHPVVFALDQGWSGPAGIIAGHAIYGLVMGALYTRPVGRRVRRMAEAHG